ncbi:MAG: peroxiredoxin [Alphaproteobacteria bacterium]|nr:peroxiredoxin [Alphaproteobacteria bacterium]
MAIQVGDSLPQTTLKQVTPSETKDIQTDSLFKGKTVALFAIPGAFTPTCTNIHMPGFNKHMDTFKAKGVEVACLAVNDPFVMDAWAKATNSHSDILILADWNADFTKAVGLTLDGSGAGLGLRSLRYSMLVKDGVVAVLNIEPSAGACDISSADTLLKSL